VAAGDAVQRAIEAVRIGKPVLLPTDTVYGLAANPYREEWSLRALRLKGRDYAQPTALLASSVEGLVQCVPELRGRPELIARTLLPGPYTLVLPNPARRFRWLTGDRAETIGVRVAGLPPPADRVLDAVVAVMATSANDPGGPDPATVDDVPERIRAGCAALIDVGRLPGRPSTVIDFSGEQPEVIREGAAPAAEALERVRKALET
jgi:L-threonylcarbamoyladenylate synthase